MQKMILQILTWLKATFAKAKQQVLLREQKTITTPLQKVYKTACAEIGQLEIIGPKHNHKIIAYHSATTLAAIEDEVPWCASFVCWCLEQNGIASTKSAAAKSYLSWGERCIKPEQGCVVVISRGERKYHVALFSHLSEDGSTIYLLGGNQGNSVNITGYSMERVLAYRKPAADKVAA